MNLPHSAVILMFLISVGCGNKDKANCATVSTHIMEMLEAELAKSGDSTSERANLPTLQNALRKTCEIQEWDLATRQCILNAKTAEATASCQPGGTSDTSEG